MLNKYYSTRNRNWASEIYVLHLSLWQGPQLSSFIIVAYTFTDDTPKISVKSTVLSGYETSSILVKCVGTLFLCPLLSDMPQKNLKLGKVLDEEVAGGPGEWWKCPQPVQCTCAPSQLFSDLESQYCTNDKITLFYLGRSISIAGTVLHS